MLRHWTRWLLPFGLKGLAARRRRQKYCAAENLDKRARLYVAQGIRSEAAKLYARALAIREKALGPDHLEVAQSCDRLAKVLYPEKDGLSYQSRLASGDVRFTPHSRPISGPVLMSANDPKRTLRQAALDVRK